MSCFSDSTPLVVFLSTFQGIRLLEVDGSRTTYSSLIQTTTSASRIDLLYSTDLIVFQHFSGGKLHKYVHTITCVIFCRIKGILFQLFLNVCNSFLINKSTVSGNKHISGMCYC